MTGSLALPVAVAGAYTFRKRQSSLGPSSWKIMSSKTGFCAQCAPYFVASRRPLHSAGGCGAFQRRSPVGGAAYGTPSHARTLPLLIGLPCSWPCFVLTTSGSALIVLLNPNSSPAARTHLVMSRPIDSILQGNEARCRHAAGCLRISANACRRVESAGLPAVVALFSRSGAIAFSFASLPWFVGAFWAAWIAFPSDAICFSGNAFDRAN